MLSSRPCPVDGIADLMVITQAFYDSWLGQIRSDSGHTPAHSQIPHIPGSRPFISDQMPCVSAQVSGTSFNCSMPASWQANMPEKMFTISYLILNC